MGLLLAQLSVDTSGSTSECKVMKALRTSLKSMCHTRPHCDQKTNVDEQYEKTRIQTKLHYDIQCAYL